MPPVITFDTCFYHKSFTVFYNKPTIHFLYQMSTWKTEVCVLAFMEVFAICLFIQRWNLSYGTLFPPSKRSCIIAHLEMVKTVLKLEETFFPGGNSTRVAVVVMSSKNVCGCCSHQHNKRWNTETVDSQKGVPFHFSVHGATVPSWKDGVCRGSLSRMPLCPSVRSHRLGAVVWWVLSERYTFIVCAVEPGVGRAPVMEAALSCKARWWQGAMCSCLQSELGLHAGSTIY